MALPTTPSSTWMSGMDLPSKVFGLGRDDYELYEADDEFVLSVELPGFDREEIDVRWDEGTLFISAEHEDESVGRQRTYSRRFRIPKEIEADDITAEYRNGVLEVRLPVLTGAVLHGKEIPVQG